MVNNIGLEAQQPAGECASPKCPWHGSLKIRGRIFRGTVVSAKPSQTAIIEWNYYRRVPKYERHARMKTRKAAHNPDCIAAKAGDVVMIGECRKISKTKNFVVYEKVA